MRGIPRLLWAVLALALLVGASLFLPVSRNKAGPHVADAGVVRGSHTTALALSETPRAFRPRHAAGGIIAHKTAAAAKALPRTSAQSSKPAAAWATTPSVELGLVQFPDPEKTGPYADRPTPEMAQFGEPASARATVAGRSFALKPNQSGEFQRVYVGRNSKVFVEVTYPSAGPGAPVFAEVMDGGRFANGSSAMRLAADARGRVGFDFQTDAEPGTYRVLLRLGEDQKTVDIWVGPPLAVRAVR
jgi:hypothetical protein